MTEQLAAQNLDVIWWSDHDWRISNYKYVARFGFEDWSEPAWTGERWQPFNNNELEDNKKLVRDSGVPAGFLLQFTNTRAYQGDKSLELRGNNSASGCRIVQAHFEADSKRHKRSLASNVAVELAAFPEIVGDGGRPYVVVKLSEHEANASVAEKEIYRLRYTFDNDGVAHREGHVYHVPVSYDAQSWQIVRLEITQDALEGFPFIIADDNSLAEIAFGVESCDGAEAAIYLDALDIQHEKEHYALYDEQRRILDTLQGLEPSVIQMQGAEISYLADHLNELAVDTTLYDYDEIAEASGLLVDGWLTSASAFRRFARQYVVDDTHARGGLISINHIFGAGFASAPDSKEQALADLLAESVFDADILEVGYVNRAGYQLAHYLWVWDQLAANQHYLVGTGVSDWHGRDLPLQINQMVSWIWSESALKADLIEGMRRGRVYFGLPERFDGTMDLTLANGAHMGNIVVTARSSVAVDIDIAGARVNDTVRVVVGGSEFSTRQVKQRDFSDTVVVEVGTGTLVRVELLDVNMKHRALSNPVFLVRNLQGVKPNDVRVFVDDSDSDGVDDLHDNCTLQPNPAQRDSDGDGIGNYCDGDFDGSCVQNFVDLAMLKQNLFAAGNLDTDMNGDKLTNFVDLALFKQGLFAAPGPSALPNICEPAKQR